MLSTSLSLPGGGLALLPWPNWEGGVFVLFRFMERKESLPDPDCAGEVAALREASEEEGLYIERFKGAERDRNGFVDVTGLSL